MMKFDKYKKNLYIEDDGRVFSYNTHVATVDYKKKTITELGWWSIITRKHVIYVRNLLDFKLIRN
jgi:hypothetical protein